MNRTKVILERIAAIITICISVFFLARDIIYLTASSEISLFYNESKVPTIIILVVLVLEIVIAAFLCRPPVVFKNGETYGGRFGLGLTLVILNGLFTILVFLGISVVPIGAVTGSLSQYTLVLYPLAYISAMILEIVSMCEKHTGVVQKQPVRVNQERPQEVPQNRPSENENVYQKPRESYQQNDMIRQIEELDKLKRAGMLSEELYLTAVEKLINK